MVTQIKMLAKGLSKIGSMVTNQPKLGEDYVNK
jgi:hypothetical protein